MIAWGWGWEWGFTVNRREASRWSDEEVLKLDDGDGHTTQ